MTFVAGCWAPGVHSLNDSPHVKNQFPDPRGQARAGRDPEVSGTRGGGKGSEHSHAGKCEKDKKEDAEAARPAGPSFGVLTLI